MLLKVDHPNIVKFEESFCNEKTNELVIIIEYCSCKFILFARLIVLVDGDLRGQIAFYTKQGRLVPENYILWYLF